MGRGTPLNNGEIERGKKREGRRKGEESPQQQRNRKGEKREERRKGEEKLQQQRNRKGEEERRGEKGERGRREAERRVHAAFVRGYYTRQQFSSFRPLFF